MVFAVIAITIITTFTPLLAAQTRSFVSPTHVIAQTFHQEDGNRFANGSVDLRNLNVIDIQLSERPSWLVGAPFENGAIWVVIHESGLAKAFKTSGTSWKVVEITPQILPPGMPPLLRVRNDKAELIVPPNDASPNTHATLVGDSKTLTYINLAGELVVESNGAHVSLPVNALPDARIVSGDQHQVAILSGPTDIYAHGVLGDRIEASSITLVSTFPTPKILKIIPIPNPWVIEGIAPIWADLNGDGKRELIVTLSSQTDGGKIAVFSETGDLIAEGPGIGRGFRWRNQMAIAPYGPEGELELSAVLTPHIGGTVEFYRWRENRLEIVASVPGFTSHIIRSRNLDLNISGDFRGTGQAALLIPNNQRNSLSAIHRDKGGAKIAFSLDIGSQLATNPAAARLADGTVSVGIGRQDATLRIWSSPSRPIKLSNWQVDATTIEELTLHGEKGRNYALETSSDLLTWKHLQIVSIPTGTDKIQINPTTTSDESSFFRTVLLPESFANILSAESSGGEGKYNLSVNILSSDIGCEDYANWWEVISDEGALLYRRILLHSHENEQPFERSGGPIFVSANETIWIRAHMKNSGYGGVALKGSFSKGFVPSIPPDDFAPDVEQLSPQPLLENCFP
jgi:hypothetical protein